MLEVSLYSNGCYDTWLTGIGGVLYIYILCHHDLLELQATRHRVIQSKYTPPRIEDKRICLVGTCESQSRSWEPAVPSGRWSVRWGWYSGLICRHTTVTRLYLLGHNHLRTHYSLSLLPDPWPLTAHRSPLVWHQSTALTNTTQWPDAPLHRIAFVWRHFSREYRTLDSQIRLLEWFEPRVQLR